MEQKFDLGSKVEMKKPHPCGTNEFEVVRMGSDIKIKCLNCKRVIMLPRRDFVKRLKRVIEK